MREGRGRYGKMHWRKEGRQTGPYNTHDTVQHGLSSQPILKHPRTACHVIS